MAADTEKRPETTLGSVPKKAWKWVVVLALIPAAIGLAMYADKLPKGTRAEAAEETEGELKATVELRGFDQWSRPVSIGENVPYNWDFALQGPDQTLVRLAGGARCSINDWLGVVRGQLRFAGPAGETVKLWIYPPGTLANTMGAEGRTCPQ